MNRTRAAFSLLLMSVFVALPLRAQEVAQSCDRPALEAVGRFLHVDNFREASYRDSTAAVVAASCKAWPRDENIVLVAAAYMLPGDPDRNSDQANRHFVVAMVDTSRDRVVRSFRSTIVQDATLQIQGHGDFHLDTAPYELAPGVRALGVVFAGGRPPRGADGWDDDYLVLLVPDGPMLRPVLTVPLEQREGSDTSHLTIGVEKTRSHGFADLSIGVRSDAGGVESPASARTIIHYNGRSYEGRDGMLQSARGDIFQP